MNSRKHILLIVRTDVAPEDVFPRKFQWRISDEKTTKIEWGHPCYYFALES